MQMTAGVTKSNEGIEGITWNILGQTYVPKQWSEHSFSWHATLPPGTFVPPHIHPEQDEFIYVLEGKFDLILDGSEAIATPGDLIRLPRGIPHGIFNNFRRDQQMPVLGVSGPQALRPVLGYPQSRSERQPGRGRRAVGKA